MTFNLQRNPSTLNLMRNAATGKLMRAVPPIIDDCQFCFPNPLPTALQITISGMSFDESCQWYGPGAHTYGKNNWAATINGTFTTDNFVSDSVWRYWSKVIEGGLETKLYDDPNCSNYIGSAYQDLWICCSIYYWDCVPFIEVTNEGGFCRYVTPPYSNGLFWNRNWMPDEGHCFEASGIVSSGNYGGTADIIEL